MDRLGEGGLEETTNLGHPHPCAQARVLHLSLHLYHPTNIPSPDRSPIDWHQPIYNSKPTCVKNCVATKLGVSTGCATAKKRKMSMLCANTLVLWTAMTKTSDLEQSYKQRRRRIILQAAPAFGTHPPYSLLLRGMPSTGNKPFIYEGFSLDTFFVQFQAPSSLISCWA